MIRSGLEVVQVHAARAQPDDLLVFVMSEEISSDQAETLRELVDHISGHTETTIMVVPEGVLTNISNYTLSDLLQLREDIDDIIKDRLPEAAEA